jgi:O-antigen ligase
MIVVGSRWSFRRQANVLVGLLVAVLFVTMLTPGLLAAMGKLVQGKAGTGSIQGRSQANEQALQVSAKHPWFGLGFGTLTTQGEAGAVITVNEGYIDNVWVEFLLTTGWIGVVALGLFFLFGTFLGLTCRARAKDRAYRDLGLTLAAMVLGIAVAGWGLSLLQYPMLLGVLYVTLGCIGALLRMVSIPAEEQAAIEASVPTQLALR